MVHPFLWPFADYKRRPSNTDNYMRRCQTNCIPLSPNRSGLGRRSTRFAPESPFPQLCDRSRPLDEARASERTGPARMDRRFRREPYSRTQSSPNPFTTQLNSQQVEHLRQDYIEKSRLADEAEDEYASPLPITSPPS